MDQTVSKNSTEMPRRYLEEGEDKMISFEEACKLAVSRGSGYDYFTEYEKAYVFGWATDVYAIGPQPLYVIKETGECFLPVEAVAERTDMGELVGEGRIPDKYLPIR